ncbi:MAG: hypothetical protein DRP13_00075 [Candidatus Aenigmatarchaeota archaeon]|nr:MAG: hypothetical protein DRP13_00075 [Candidatus Aenigmarchaeota archaeon]
MESFKMLGEKELSELSTEELKEYTLKLTRYAQMLEKTAYTDPLTGLRNRQALEYDLKEFKKKERTSIDKEKTHAFLVVDVDNFKGMNDNYGHSTGDHILRRLAGALEKNTRVSRGQDRVYEGRSYRWGGDEFAVLLVDVNPEDVPYIAKRIVNGIKSQAEKSVKALERLWRMKGYEPSDTERNLLNDIRNVSVSIGIAVFEEQYKDVFRWADEALYKVKQNGKNGYHIA